MNDNGNIQVWQNKDSTNYLLTSTRHLLRILDLGLIVPELVASDEQGKIMAFTEAQLKMACNDDSYPRMPVIIELKSSCFYSVDSVENIVSLHFNTEQSIQDFESRVFENVPIQLFKKTVSAHLFNYEPSELLTFSLNKVDKNLLKEKYRFYDVVAGFLWQYISCIRAPDKLIELLHSIQNTASSNDITIPNLTILFPELYCAEEERFILNSYIEILTTLDIDEGWVDKEVFERLIKAFTSKVIESKLTKTWINYCEPIIKGEAPFKSLSDKGSITLRAILLHILNPDVESINRMAEREPPFGTKVLATSRLLSSARTGLSPLPSGIKVKHSGLFFLLANLMAAIINKQELQLSYLTFSPNNNINWHNHLIAEFPDFHSSHVNELSKSDDSGDDTETPIPQPNEYISKIVTMLTTVSFIKNLVYKSEDISFEVDKSAFTSIKKAREFNIVLNGSTYEFMTQVVDITRPSQKGYLTKDKLYDMLGYQTNKGVDFRFELDSERNVYAKCFGPLNTLNNDKLHNILNSLVDSIDWVKNKQSKK